MWRSRMVLIGLTLIVGIIAGGAAQSPKRTYKYDWQQRLLPQRLDTARKVYEQKWEHLVKVLQEKKLEPLQANLPSELFVWSERWLDAELAIAANYLERLNAFQTYRERAIETEHTLAALVQLGQAQQEDADAAAYHRIEAEIRWETEKAAP